MWNCSSRCNTLRSLIIDELVKTYIDVIDTGTQRYNFYNCCNHRSNQHGVVVLQISQLRTSPGLAVSSCHHKLIADQEAVTIFGFVFPHFPSQKHHVGSTMRNSWVSHDDFPCLNWRSKKHPKMKGMHTHQAVSTFFVNGINE